MKQEQENISLCKSTRKKVKVEKKKEEEEEKIEQEGAAGH
jgi:hypothetical protein